MDLCSSMNRGSNIATWFVGTNLLEFPGIQPILFIHRLEMLSEAFEEFIGRPWRGLIALIWYLEYHVEK